jgi:hypothetical protein
MYRKFLSEQTRFSVELLFIEYPEFVETRERSVLAMLGETRMQMWIPLLKQLVSIQYAF